MSADTRPAEAPGVDYWRRRARAMGERAVVSTDHDGDLAAVADGHRAALLPLLAAELTGDEQVVLDLGCGCGRFTDDLAVLIDGRAVGVDPVDELLALAPASPRVEYRPMRAGRLPLADAEADVVFCSMVLGGLPPAALHATLAEARRVLAPGGLVFLAESDGTYRDGHWRARTPAAHRALIPWARLRQVGAFDDAGDAIAVLAGRR